MNKESPLVFSPDVTEKLDQLKIKIFADGADLNTMLEWHQSPYIKGFTTNPSLIRTAGVDDYEAFARKVLQTINDHPISIEVFGDDLKEMEKQARYIASWGSNVNIKIPVTNTQGKFTGPLIERLSKDGIYLNITAIMTLEQVESVAQSLSNDTPAIISVFAGRIADTGVDPIGLMVNAVQLLKDRPNIELLWASPREVLNIFQADEAGCHIITVASDLLKKLSLVGQDLTLYSLKTVKQFYNDAQMAGYQLKPNLNDGLSIEKD